MEGGNWVTGNLQDLRSSKNDKEKFKYVKRKGNGKQRAGRSKVTYSLQNVVEKNNIPLKNICQTDLQNSILLAQLILLGYAYTHCLC